MSFTFNKPHFRLPVDEDIFKSEEDFIDSLLHFTTTTPLYNDLTNNLHILDFFTRTPDIYQIIPTDWNSWFESQDIHNILDFFLRADLSKDLSTSPQPPRSLLQYVKDIRNHSLRRDFTPLPLPAYVRNPKQPGAYSPTQKDLLMGMKLKKIHEVTQFARFVAGLADQIGGISHLVDFGCGVNYLGRVLASPPYGRELLAIESRETVLASARELDVRANLNKDKKPKMGRANNRQEVTEYDDNEDLQKTGTVTYIKASINSGHIQEYISPHFSEAGITDFSLLVMSLHSCGNLVHHGLRSLVLNPSVTAVAMIGCCYNLITDKLAPLQDVSPSSSSSSIVDLDGFPMSSRFTTTECSQSGSKVRGVRLNMSAKKMAVQAPLNWSRQDSEGFFTRHFYRALLQKILVDKQIVNTPPVGLSSAISRQEITPIVIGSLRAPAYVSFVSYVRAAVSKLVRTSRGEIFIKVDQAPGPANQPNELAGAVEERLGSMTDAEIEAYENKYKHRKKDLSVLWSLMAFSAQVVEATILCDRWQWLREQGEVEDAFVCTAFSYDQSPRNMVIVGVKKAV